MQLPGPLLSPSTPHSSANETRYPNIKKALIFLQKKAFLIFPQLNPCTFHPQARKIKEIQPGKMSYTSGNENPQKVILFSEKKAILILWETKTPKWKL